MWRWLKRIMGLNGPAQTVRNAPSRRVNASYDIAKSKDDHWKPADLLSAAAANDPGTRSQLRRKARYETANNSHCRGVTLTLANDLVGLGPQLQVQLPGDDGEDDDRTVTDEQRIEDSWQAWCDEVNLAEKLNTLALSKIIDGESFALMVTNPALSHPVKLDIKPIEADRVCTPGFGEFGGEINPWFADGIEFDQHGNPKLYHVLNRHPGDNWALNPLAFLQYPAKSVIHWFRKDRPGQVRGVPEILSALPLFSQLRRYTLAVLEAAETAASFSVILQTEAMPLDTSGNPILGEAFEGIEIDKGMMVTAPAGYKMAQMKAEQPVSTHDQFQQTILREVFHCLNMPYSVGAGDFSKDSYSSGRLGLQTYLRIVKQARHHMKLTVLDRIFAEWLKEAMLVEILPPMAFTPEISIAHDWHFDPFPSIDPLKDGKADEMDLMNGVTTQSELCAERKRDWRKINRQREREIKDQKKRGIFVEVKPPASQPMDDSATSDMGVANAA